MQIWRVNAQKRSLVKEDVPPAWEMLGGRGLSARILLDEVEHTCEPLGRRNKLVFAPGLLVGHMLSSCDRISVGAKSPLTQGIKESNAGVSTGLQLTRLGIKALIIEDLPDDQNWQVMVLSRQGVHFEPADELIGLGVYNSARKLLERYGDKAAMAIIGPGG